VGVARVVFGGALVAVPVLAGPAGHDLLRVVLLDLGQESAARPPRTVVTARPRWEMETEPSARIA